MPTLKPLEAITARILVIRDNRVLMDADLAALYGVTTKRLNEQVKRNKARFPADFMFKLTAKEKAEVVANCDHLASLKFSRNRPYVFIEFGCIQAANILNSPKAVTTGVHVVRAFVRCGNCCARTRISNSVSTSSGARSPRNSVRTIAPSWR